MAIILSCTATHLEWVLLQRYPTIQPNDVVIESEVNLCGSKFYVNDQRYRL